MLPSRTDGIVADASRVIGGPVGRHAAVGRSKYWTPLRVLFGLSLCVLALSWFGKAGCLQQTPAEPAENGSSMRLDWDDQRQFTGLCYSDIIALYSAERLDEGEMPYRTFWYEENSEGQEIKRYMEYPVVTGMFMYGAAGLAQIWSEAADNWGIPAALDVVLFFNLVAVGLALAWLVTIWATALTARHRIWATWVAAVSPLVLVHAFTNFDALATAMIAVAMLFWARRQPVWTGVFIGLGVATKLYPGLLLFVLLVLCLRTGRVRDFVTTAAAAAIAWSVVNLPILIAFPNGWREFFRFNAERGADTDSLLRIVANLAGFTWKLEVVNLLSMALLAVVAAGVAYLALRAPTRPRLAQLMFLMVAGFLLVNKVWSPQYSLWLVPLAVLAIPDARLLLGWMAVDALVWIPRMSLFIDDDRKWLPEEWFTLTIVLRAVMVLLLCAVVIWQIYHPDRDAVRVAPASGQPLDDPGGGVFDGGPGAYRGAARDVLLRRPTVSTCAGSGPAGTG